MLKDEMTKAMAEIGPIKPWWSDEDGMFVFEHKKYPFVIGGGLSEKDAKASYQRALKVFIKDRLTGELAPEIDRVTSGRGGRRPGAGRPKGSTAEKTKRISVPVSMVEEIQRLVAAHTASRKAGTGNQRPRRTGAKPG